MKAILKISKSKKANIEVNDTVSFGDELFLFGKDIEIAKSNSETAKNLFIALVLRKTPYDLDFKEDDKACYIKVNVGENMFGEAFTSIYNVFIN